MRKEFENQQAKCQEAVVATVTPIEAPEMDLTTAIQVVLRKSLAHGGLARGLHEGAKAIEKHGAQLCLLAEDCDQPDYVKLVKALCSDHNTDLLPVPSAKTLGEWVGVSIYFCQCLFVCSFSCEVRLGSKWWLLIIASY